MAVNGVAIGLPGTGYTPVPALRPPRRLTFQRITPDDWSDLLAIMEECYKTPFDPEAVYRWGMAALQNPTIIAVRSADAFGLAQAAGLPWLPKEIHGCQLYIAMRPKAVWQGVRIMRIMANWCTGVMGAVDYQFGEATGMRMEIFAKRLGARPNRPTYILGGA